MNGQDIMLIFYFGPVENVISYMKEPGTWPDRMTVFSLTKLWLT